MKYIFYNLPKTGGQSINLTFRKYLVYHKTLIHLGYHGEEAARELDLVPWRDRTLAERDMAFFIMGHKVDINTKNHFGTGRAVKEMILFREPALHLVSLYNFKYRHKEKPPSFSAWYTLLKIRGGKNWQATNFFRHYLKKNYLNSYFLKDFNYFKSILDNFWFVGVTENINCDFEKNCITYGY